MFALLLRYFMQIGAQQNNAVFIVLSAIASLFIGNLLALLQQNVKRILAYSSIAHLGYLVVAFLASGTLAAETVTYYLAIYFVTMLGAFGVVTVLSDPQQDADLITDYRGLFWRSPWSAASSPPRSCPWPGFRSQLALLASSMCSPPASQRHFGHW